MDPSQRFRDMLKKEKEMKAAIRKEKRKQSKIAKDLDIVKRVRACMANANIGVEESSSCQESSEQHEVESSPNYYVEDNEEDFEMVERLRETNKRDKRPTYIESSKSSWDEIRHKILSRFMEGMSCRTNDIRDRPKVLYDKCPACAADLEECVDELNVKVLTLTGLISVNLPKCVCATCGWRWYTESVDCVRIALWPVDSRCHMWIDFNLMFHSSVLTHMSPGLSLGSILETLKFTTSLTGVNTFYMKQDVFNYTFSEWRRQEMKFFEVLAGGDIYTCPACEDAPHAVHIDGNMKLYRYTKKSKSDSSALRTTSLEEEESDFFVPSTEVVATVAQVSRQKENVVENTCGNSVWKAAATESRAHSKKEETGCMLATCRHCFLLKGLDMTQGEIYAYPYTLQKCFPSAKFIALDTMCKYWGWLERIDQPRSESQKPFLSILHAKSHQWRCQVTWSGRCREGVGLSTGETTEQANSYMSRLGAVTRTMEATGRRRRLQDGAGFWNIRKIVDLPAQIKKNLDKAHLNVAKLTETVTSHCQSLDLTLESLEVLSKEVRNVGLGLNPVERKIEELACSIHQRTGEIFNTADTSKRRTAKRRQLATEKGKLKVQAELYHKRNPDTTVDSILSAVSTMRFPWSTRSCTSQITPEVLKAVEDYHLLNRTKEEIPILERERDTMIRVLSMRCMSSKNVFLQNLVDKAKDLFADHFEPVDLIAMFHDDELEPEGGDVSEDDVCSDVVDIVM